VHFQDPLSNVIRTATLTDWDGTVFKWANPNPTNTLAVQTRLAFTAWQTHAFPGRPPCPSHSVVHTSAVLFLKGQRKCLLGLLLAHQAASVSKSGVLGVTRIPGIRFVSNRIASGPLGSQNRNASAWSRGENFGRSPRGFACEPLTDLQQNARRLDVSEQTVMHSRWSRFNSKFQ
jgi:hypothetical protein